MHENLIDYSSTRKLPTGRRIFVMQAVRKAADGYGDQPIVDKCDASIEHDRATMKKELAYLEQKHNTTAARGNASAIDRKIDDRLGRMFAAADSQAFGEDDTAKKAAEFLTQIFPDGVAGLVNLSFEEQLAAMDSHLERFDGDLADHVDALGLRRHVGSLQKLVPAFRAELEKESGMSVTFADVKAARTTGHDLFAGAIFRVLDTYGDPANPEHATRREAILVEYHRQNAIIAEAYRRRESVEDIDPDTGEPVTDDQPQEDVVEPTA